MKWIVLFIIPLFIACTNNRTSPESGSLDTEMILLPDYKGYKVVAVTSTNPAGNEATNLYTFDQQGNKLDSLQVISVEPLESYHTFIMQDYKMNQNNTITETKYLNNQIIEQLTYEITGKGEFAEVRDGKTPVIAYEMFNNTDQFVVESFIWDTTPEGGLIKKELTQTTYNLTRLLE
ncbi:MAG: hypothetical protein LUE98_05030 [Tannerellaceae bacterium]|nr:hypothetical protein [Tannerellaceae bacterium]